MANKKITDLNSLDAESLNTADVFPIVDIDADETKKIVISDVKTFVNSGSFTGDATGLSGTPSIAVTNVTASGGISASGDIKANSYYSNGVAMMTFAGLRQNFGSATSASTLNGTTISVNGPTNFSSDITASVGKIWASQYNITDGGGAAATIVAFSEPDQKYIVGVDDVENNLQLNGARIYMGDYQNPLGLNSAPSILASGSFESKLHFDAPKFKSSTTQLTIENQEADGSDIHITASMNLRAKAMNGGIELLAPSMDAGDIHITSSNYAVDVKAGSNIGLRSTGGNINLNAGDEGGNVNLTAGLISGDVSVSAPVGKFSSNSNKIHITGSDTIQIYKGGDDPLSIGEIKIDATGTVTIQSIATIKITGSNDVRFTDLPSTQPSVSGGLWVSGSVDNGSGAFNSKFVCIFKP